MCYVYISLLLLLCACRWKQVNLLQNGLARTPPMGWMSWGYYMCSTKCEQGEDKCLNESLIMSVADTFYSEGYLEAGYEYIIVDDCWSEKRRDVHERLVPDKKRFPRGMKFLADYIHSKGLKFGMYTNIAKTTCMKFPGSKDHFAIDAKTFAEWEIDYLKVDGCFVSEKDLNVGYILLGNELNKTGRPILYSCSWPYYIEFIHEHQPDIELVSKYCNVWRNYHDVQTSWNAVINIIEYFKTKYSELSPYHGPGKWNDPDMLIFGTGVLTHSQSRLHLAVYVMLSAPLLLSCDLKKITPYEKKLLLNLDLIAIAQDPMGIMAAPFTLRETTIWVKPHYPKKGDIYPSFTFCIMNAHIDDYVVTFTPSFYGLNSTDGYTVLDIFSGVYIKNITLKEEMTINVPGEGTRTWNRATTNEYTPFCRVHWRIKNPNWWDRVTISLRD